jgi:hypothetical protein
MKKLFAILLILSVVAQADSKRFQNQVNIVDGQMRSGAPNNNFGVSTTWTASDTTGWRYIISFPALAESLGAGKNITAIICSLSIYNSSANATDTTNIYRTYKPYLTHEGTLDNVTATDSMMSWNDFSATTFEWATAGCNMAKDDTLWNACDNSCADRTATPLATIYVTSTGWCSFTIPENLGDSLYTGRDFGFILISTRINSISGRSSENTTEANRPILWVTYEDAPTGDQTSARRRRLLLE